MAMNLNVLRTPPQQSPLTQRLSVIREALLAMDEGESVRVFALPRFDQLLKSTISLCPQCLQPRVPGLLQRRQRRSQDAAGDVQAVHAAAGEGKGRAGFGAAHRRRGDAASAVLGDARVRARARWRQANLPSDERRASGAA